MNVEIKSKTLLIFLCCASEECTFVENFEYFQALKTYSIVRKKREYIIIMENDGSNGKL